MSPEILQPTTFPLDPADPLAPFHRIAHDFLKRLPREAFLLYDSPASMNWQQVLDWYRDAAAGVLAMPLETQLGCIRACARFSSWTRFEWRWSSHDKAEETNKQMAYETALFNLCSCILEQPREWNEEELPKLVELPVPYAFPKERVVTRVFENYLLTHPVSPRLRPAVERVRGWNTRVHLFPSWFGLSQALGDELTLQSGEAWADDARGFILGLPEHEQVAWREFLLSCFDSDKAKPSAKWLRQAQVFLERIGADVVERECALWFASWGTEPLEINEAVLKGVVWSASFLEGSEVARALGTLALSASELGEIKRTSHRTRSASLFNASVWSLSQSKDGLPVLWELKDKVQQKSLGNSLEKAIAVTKSRASS